MLAVAVVVMVEMVTVEKVEYWDCEQRLGHDSQQSAEVRTGSFQAPESEQELHQNEPLKKGNFLIKKSEFNEV